MLEAYSVRPATVEDAELLAPRIKPADVAEVWAASHRTPLQALLEGFCRPGKVWAGLRAGEPFLLFGVGDLPGICPIGVPWMLSVPMRPGEALALLRRSRHHVETMRDGYTILQNWTDARHTESHQWLRWCGFRLEPAAPYGADGLPFHRFWMPGNV